MSAHASELGSLCGSIEEKRARQAMSQMDAAMDTLKATMISARAKIKERDDRRGNS